MLRSSAPVDLLIIGSGIMGSVVARMVHDARPDARIVMVDAGRNIGSIRGQHLHDSAEPEVRDEYLGRARYGIQSAYLGADVTPSIGDGVAGIRPGMYNMSAFGADAAQMPASAMAWNLGGMGVHWTAATPWPWGDEEFRLTGDAAWEDELDTARRMLRVHPAPFPPHIGGARVLEVFEDLYGRVSAPGRHVQPMPMAVVPQPDGPMPRIGPNRIYPRLLESDGEDFELVDASVVTSLIHDGTRVAGVRLRHTETGEEGEIRAARVLVAADTLRTPQLLFASGIRPEALGTHLNEHAMLSARALVDTARLGLDLEEIPLALEGEWMTGSFWLPQSGPAQPFHGQLSDHVYVSEKGERLAYAVGFSLYAPTQIVRENRLEFSDTRTDAAGLPLITIRFGLTDDDEAMLDEGRRQQHRIGERLGDFEPGRDATLLAAGSSLHFTGTARSGRADDGTTVTDPAGKVWGFENLWLAGGAVVPTAVVGNSTLTATVTAVRAARAILTDLGTA